MGLCSTRYAGPTRLDGKTAIITGCNTGIGKFTALDFYKRGCRVIMACRNEEKATAAREDIIKKTAGEVNVGELVVRVLDISSLQSVRAFAAQIIKEERAVNLLINNAGVMMCPKGKTVDGFEVQFGTNHLGHYLLTLLLLPRILASTPARIVCLSSLAHELGSIDFDNLNAEKSYSPIKNYAVSKLANVLFAKELARRLEGKQVTVYAVHPGVVNTDLARHTNSAFFPGAQFFYQKLGGWLQKDEEQGAATSIYCAVDPKTGAESGLYYADVKAVPCSRKAEDAAVAKQLWDVSAEMVQLGDLDPFVAKPLDS